MNNKTSISKIVLFIFILILIPSVIAWSEGTHTKFAEEVCNRLSECNSSCMGYIKDGSYYVVDTLHEYDSVNLYKACTRSDEAIWCGSNCEDCTTGSFFMENTPILRKDAYLSEADTFDNCTKFFDIGIAGFYFLESKEFWNQVKGEKATCVDNYESDVNREVTSSFEDDWTVIQCEQELTGETFRSWLDEFIEEVELVAGASGIKSEHPATQETDIEQTQQVTTSVQYTSGTCVFNQWKYTQWLCASGNAVNDLARKKGVDSTSIFIAVIIIIIVYNMLFGGRGRRR